MVTVEPSPELLELAERSRQAFREGDDAWFTQALGDGEVANYGSAPGEVWRGREQLLAQTLAEFRRINEEVGIDADYEDPERHVEAFEAGDTGWIVTHSVFRFTDGSEVPVRSIVVLSRDENRAWKMVLLSVHGLIPNEVLEPGSPVLGALASAPAGGST
jgi:hypothetical protein